MKWQAWRLACLALLVALASRASAVELGSFGFRSGVSIAHISTSGIGLDWGSRTGFAGGFHQQIAINERFSIQPELLFISKGGEMTAHIRETVTGQPTQEFDVHVEHALDYLEFPVLARFDVTPAGFVHPYVLTGPSVAFRTSARSELSFEGATVTPAPAGIQNAQIFEEVGTFDQPNYKKVDWSWIGGGGVQLGRGAVRFGVEARYGYGVSNLYPSDNVKAHNHALSVMAGIDLR